MLLARCIHPLFYCVTLCGEREAGRKVQDTFSHLRIIINDERREVVQSGTYPVSILSRRLCGASHPVLDDPAHPNQHPSSIAGDFQLTIPGLFKGS